MFVGAHQKAIMTRNLAVIVTPASGSLTIAGARIIFEPTAYDGSESSRVNFVLGVKRRGTPSDKNMGRELLPTRSQQDRVQCPHGQRPGSQDQQGQRAALGGQETSAAARTLEGQSLQRHHTVVRDVDDEESARTVPEGNGHRAHGAGDRVPIRPIGRPRSHAFWDGQNGS